MAGMTKNQFKKALVRGLGSALAELMSCSDPGRYRETVRYACLHNTTYDMQSEGVRGWYLFRAIQLVNGTDIFEDDIIDRFIRMTKDEWLFDQLTSILIQYAEYGCPKARQALYQKYNQLLTQIETSKNSDEWCPLSNMLEWLTVWLTKLDGFRAFQQIAQDFGRNILRGNGDDFFFDWFYVHARDKFGDQRVDGYLTRRAAHAPELKAFFEAVQDSVQASRDQDPIPTLENLLSNAQQTTDESHSLDRFLMRRFARNARTEDLAELAAVAMREPNEAIRSELLWPLRYSPDPILPISTLLELASSDNEDIRDTAYQLMEQQPCDEVHDLALQLIMGDRDLIYGISLLSCTFRRVDEAILYDRIRRIPVNRESEWHEAFSAAARFFIKGRWIPQTNLLGYMYEATLCGCCRLDIVERMHQHRVLTPRLAHECLLDSNPEIRAFARRLAVNRGLTSAPGYRSDSLAD